MQSDIQYQERLASHYAPPSVYSEDTSKAQASIRIPDIAPTLEQPVGSSSLSTQQYPRLMTLSQQNEMQQRLISAENEVLKREENCRVCGKHFSCGSGQLEKCYQEHKEQLAAACPLCTNEWVHASIGERQKHILAQHSTAASTGFPASAVEVTGCPYEGCSTDLTDRTHFGTTMVSYAHLVLNE